MIFAASGIFIIIMTAAFLIRVNPPSKSPATSQPTVAQPKPAPSGAPSPSQDPQDIIPGLYPDPIKNTATGQGFKITSVMVENNTDSAGNPVSDHLQLILQNLTTKDLSPFEIYYTIADTTSNKKEGYYKKLANFVLPAGASQTIHFDNQQGTDHFTANTHSLYFTSTNKLQFNVMINTPGYAVQTAQVEKAAGGAETKD